MQDGERVVFRNAAHQLPGATPGDVIIIIAQKAHPTFNRRGTLPLASLPLPILLNYAM